MKLRLASESPYRKALLQRCHISFESQKPKIDEEELKKTLTHLPPEKLCEALAEAKASSIKEEFPDDIIIGSDQLVAFNNTIIGKGHDKEGTLHHLKTLNGKTHQLITSVCVISKEKKEVFSHSSLVTLKSLSEAELISYLEIDRPYKCAGGYMIERAGPLIIESLQTTDPTSIEGLPMMKLTAVLQGFGYKVY